MQVVGLERVVRQERVGMCMARLGWDCCSELGPAAIPTTCSAMQKVIQNTDSVFWGHMHRHAPELSEAPKLRTLMGAKGSGIAAPTLVQYPNPSE